MMLKPGGASGEGDEALEFYAKHTAQIEVIIHKLLQNNSKKIFYCIFSQNL